MPWSQAELCHAGLRLGRAIRDDFLKLMECCLRVIGNIRLRISRELACFDWLLEHVPACTRTAGSPQVYVLDSMLMCSCWSSSMKLRLTPLVCKAISERMGSAMTGLTKEIQRTTLRCMNTGCIFMSTSYQARGPTFPTPNSDQPQSGACLGRRQLLTSPQIHCMSRVATRSARGVNPSRSKTSNASVYRQSPAMPSATINLIIHTHHAFLKDITSIWPLARRQRPGD